MSEVSLVRRLCPRSGVPLVPTPPRGKAQGTLRVHLVAAGITERSSKMKQIPGKFRKRTGWVKAIGMGLGMIVIAWGTPLSADTRPGDTIGWFSHQTQSTHQMAADLQNDGMNILMARGGGGGGQARGGGKGKGQGSGQCDGSGSGQGKGKGYGAKDGTGTGERPQDGSGYGAGSGSGPGGGSGKKDGSGGKGNR